MAKELLRKPDVSIFAMSEDEDSDGEYVIDHIKRISTNSNWDDSVMNIALILRNCNKGNIKR